MITPLVNRPGGVVCATLAVSLVTTPARERKRATLPLDGSQYVSNGIPNCGTADPSGCRFPADPAHPIRCQFRTSAEAFG